MVEKNASHNAEIAIRDEEIALLKSDRACPLPLLEKKIASLESEVNKFKHTAIVDLIGEGAVRENKRPRTNNTPKSGLAILHMHNQKMVQVKQEKNAAETTLKSVRQE